MPQSAYFVFKNIYFESHTISYIPLIIKFSVSLSLILSKLNHLNGLPRWLSGKESACQCKRHRFNLWVRKIPWRRKWQPTPVSLPGKPHGQRSLVGYSPWDQKELDTTEWLNNNKALLYFYIAFSFCEERFLSMLTHPNKGRAAEDEREVKYVIN